VSKMIPEACLEYSSDDTCEVYCCRASMAWAACSMIHALASYVLV